MRKLNFCYTLGTVQLTLKFDDGESFKFTVQPIHAMVISCFSKDDSQTTQVRFSLPTICEKLDISDTNFVLSALLYWVDNGVLSEVEDQVFESKSTRSRSQ